MKLFEYLDKLDLYTYLKVKDTGDISLLRSVFNFRDERLKEIWEEIELQVVEVIGVGDVGEVLMNLESELLYMKNEYIINGERDILTEINMKSKEIETIKSKMISGMSPFETVIVLEKYYGFEIDEKKTNVRKYLDRLNYMLKNGDKSN
jgi:hypothetical protein